MKVHANLAMNDRGQAIYGLLLMNASIARLASELPATAPDRRKERRYAAREQIVIQSSKGPVECAFLSDISLHGCSVISDAHWLRNGTFVSIGFDEASMLQAIVRWVRNGAVGMEFVRPIPHNRQEWHDLLDVLC